MFSVRYGFFFGDLIFGRTILEIMVLVMVAEAHFVEYSNEIGNDALNCDPQIQFDVQLMPKKIYYKITLDKWHAH